ncbi:MAG: CHAP domain-containing protein [Nocardioidaceae bacterium]
MNGRQPGVRYEGGPDQCAWWAIDQFHACSGLYPNLRNPANNGNAMHWVTNASYNYWTVVSTPRVHSIAVFPLRTNGAGPVGHVAWVTGVSAGNITITKMNYAAWNTVDTRTLTPAASVRYILAP